MPPLADLLLRNAENLRQIAVGKAVLLGLQQQFVRQQAPLVLENLLFKLYQFLHLLQKPGFDMGALVQKLNIRPLAQRLVQNELPLAGRLGQQFHQFGQRPAVEILGKAEPVAAVFQGADRLLHAPPCSSCRCS